jgi:outer membrane protein assembly factor BamB
LTCAATARAQTPARPSPPPALRAIWTVPLKAALGVPPAFEVDRGFFSFSDGRLEARSLATGAVLWSTEANVLSQPAIGDGLLFLVERDAIAALELAHGTRAWRLPFTDALATPLVWDNGWLIAATESGRVLAFRATDGDLLWTREIGSAPSARPALAADRVYVPAGDSRVVALQVETGAIVWESRVGGAPNEPLALGDRIYVGSDDNFFYCLKTDDGDVDWRWRTGADVIGPPVADDRAVYFVSKDNVLRALNRRSGNQLWKRALPLRPSAGPVRLADSLIVSGVAPALRAFLAKDGAPAGEVATEGELAAAAHVFEGAEGYVLTVITRTLAGGAAMTAVTRVSEPPPTPAAPVPAAPRADIK